jgi:hypothetical protein
MGVNGQTASNKEVHMSSTWNIVSLGDRKHRLEGPSGHMIGWIHGHAIGLSGLLDDREALAWTPSLRRALDDTLVRHYPGRYRPVTDFTELRLVHDGAYEWIAAGNVPIARVYRTVSGRGGGCVAVEFVLPSYVSERAAIASANTLMTMLKERMLSPSLTDETEESSHVGTTVSFESSSGQRERRRRERLARQFSGK